MFSVNILSAIHIPDNPRHDLILSVGFSSVVAVIITLSAYLRLLVGIPLTCVPIVISSSGFLIISSGYKLNYSWQSVQPGVTPLFISSFSDGHFFIVILTVW